MNSEETEVEYRIRIRNREEAEALGPWIEADATTARIGLRLNSNGRRKVKRKALTKDERRAMVSRRKGWK